MTGADNELLEELKRIIQTPSGDAMSDATVQRLTLATLINLDRRIREIEKMAPVVRIMLWVGTAIGASIVGLIWSVITGQASIVFGS